MGREAAAAWQGGEHRGAADENSLRAGGAELFSKGDGHKPMDHRAGGRPVAEAWQKS